MIWQVIENSWRDTSVEDASTRETICRLSLNEEEVTEENQDELQAAQLKKANLIAAAPRMWRLLKDISEEGTDIAKWLEIEKIINELGEL